MLLDTTTYSLSSVNDDNDWELISSNRNTSQISLRIKRNLLPCFTKIDLVSVI